MIKFLVFSAIFFFLGFILNTPETMVTIELFHYRIFGSIFTFFAVFLFVLFLCKLLISPIYIFKKFHNRHKKIIELKKHDLSLNVLLALTNQEIETYESLLKKSEKLYGSENYIYWIIRCLLAPDEDSYHQMMRFPQTTMGGIRGLFHLAGKDGDLAQMRNLLENMPDKKKKSPWALQAFFQLLVQENDWENALNHLKDMKKILTKDDYTKRRATCLLLNGDVKEAYNLDPNNPNIVIAYAKNNLKKAGKILKRLWEKNPCWPLYETYKEILAQQDAKIKQQAIKDLTSSNPHDRLSLLALAEIYLDTQTPLEAKKYLDEYLQTYSLTKQVALMQARIERDAWNHEEQAREWEAKAPETEEDEVTWHCETCDYKSPTWHAVCPVCHTFNSFK